MTKNNRFLLLFVLTYSLGLLWISAHNFISHSEFWSITIAQKLGSASFDAISVYYKLLFYTLLKPLHWLPLGNWNHTQTARLIFGGLAGLGFGLWLFNLQRIFKNQWLILTYGLFILSFQVYFYNSYRVRADGLANLIAIIIFSKMTWNYQNSKIPKIYDLQFLVLFLFLLVTTPKAIYLIALLQVYYFVLFRKNLTSSAHIISLFLFGAFPLALCLFVTAMSFEFGWLAENPYAQVIQYHFNSFAAFWDKATWTHILATLKINGLNYLLIVIGLCLFTFNKRLRNNHQYQALIATSLVALFCVLIHPEKWTYFLAQWIPWLTLPYIFTLQSISKKWQRNLLSTVILILPFGLANATSYFTPNTSQKMAIQRLEPLFKKIPHAMYMDSTGLFPREKMLFSFLGPNDSTGKEFALLNIRRLQPDFIFFTGKMNRAAPEIYQILFEYYANLEPDVWVLKNKQHLVNWHPDSPPPPLRALFIFDYLPRTRF